jgi:hypothetical protein
MFFAGLWFLSCCFVASQPAVTDVSLSLAFRPWWSNWKSALVVFFVVFVLVAMLKTLQMKLLPRDSVYDENDAAR